LVIRHSFVIRISIFVIVLFPCLLGHAAPDDEEITAEAAAAARQNRVMFAEQNFDQWVFQGVNNAEAGRKRLQTQAELRLAEIQRICQLSAAQKRKLDLAALGDFQRFNDQVELVRRKFDAVKGDQNAWGNLWPEIQPLQLKQAEGLLGHDSLVMKILPKTLNSEQAAAYEKVINERRKFRYRASIANSLIMLEGAVPLKHAHREALTKLLIEETQPPQVFGQYDHYLVMYRLAHLPAAKIRPLFDDRQWQAIQPQFNQYRGMQSFLVQQGLLPPEEANQPVALPPAAAQD
jgi:hypothetical protein